jgi:hypothetical protein
VKRKIFLPILAVGALTLITVFGVATYRTVSAAASAVSSENAAVPITSFINTAQTLSTNNNVMMGFGRGMGGGVTDQGLATALGINVTKLQAAYQTATAAALKQAVTAGLITQAQADQYTARGDVIRGLNGAEWLTANGIDYKSLLANALGVGVDKLQAGYTQAFSASVDSAVQSGNMTQTQADLAKAQFALANSSKFQSDLQAAYKSAVQQAVTDGTITQAQADQILKSASGMGLPGLDGFGGPGGHGGFGGGRGFGGGPGFGPNDNQNGTNNPNNAAPSAPAATPSGSGL